MFDLSRHQQYQHELAGTPSSVAFVNDSHQQSQLRNLSFYDFIFEVLLAFSASRNLDCLEPQILFRRVTPRQIPQLRGPRQSTHAETVHPYLPHLVSNRKIHQKLSR